MANYLTSPSKVQLSGIFGINAFVELAFDKKYSIKSDSIVAYLRHDIKRGYTLIDFKNLKLSDNAKLLI